MCRFFTTIYHHLASLAVGALLAASLLASALPEAAASDDATIIMYHRFGEDNLPATNIPLDVFDAHLATIKAEGWKVLPLHDLITRLKTGAEIPDKALAITIDDAFLSVYSAAFPRLKAYGYPFTIFVATQAIDQGLKAYASWEQIREMHAHGVEIGSQSHTHPHLHRLSPDAVRQEIATSNARFQQELGITPRYFAYPYGEYNLAVRDMLAGLGFEAAFGQASGVAHTSTHAYEYPRFAFNAHYGTVKRLKTAVEARALPVSDITNPSMLVASNPPILGFTVGDDVEALEQLTCFATNMGKLEVAIKGRRVEIRLPQAITATRSRINCTVPLIEHGKNSGRFRWYGRQFLLN